MADNTADILAIRRDTGTILMWLGQLMASTEQVISTTTATAAASSALAVTQASLADLLATLILGQATQEEILEEVKAIKTRLDLAVVMMGDSSTAG